MTAHRDTVNISSPSDIHVPVTSDSSSHQMPGASEETPEFSIDTDEQRAELILVET